jgi:hypothetical protein
MLYVKSRRRGAVAGNRRNVMAVRASLSGLLIAAATLIVLPAAAADPLYTLENATTLPSTNTGWDYVSLDAATGRLFMDRRVDGLTVFDINEHSQPQWRTRKARTEPCWCPSSTVFTSPALMARY